MSIRQIERRIPKSPNSDFLPSKDAMSYFHDRNEFPKFFNNLHQAGDEGKIVSFLEVYFSKYPLFRPLLVQLYFQLVNNTGQIRLAKEICRIYTEASDLLLDLGQRELGMPPIFENHFSSMNTRSLTNQTAYTYHMRQLGELDVKPLFCLDPAIPYLRQNQNSFIVSFLPYLNDVFEVITEEKKIADYFRLRTLAPFNSTFFSRQKNVFGHTNNFFSEMYAELKDKALNPWAFKLKDVTRDLAQKFLKNFGLFEKDDFVVIHIRENVSDDSFHNKFRNHNAMDYNEAIHWLLSSGLKVVRIGHKNMTPLPERSGFIDLTCVECPGEVSIYLCAMAKFYFGSLSGPVDLATHFGTQLLLSDLNLYDYSSPRSLVQLLTFVNQKTDQLISKRDIELLELESLTSVQPFFRKGLVPKFGESSKHLRSVKEMVEKIEVGEGDELRLREETSQKEIRLVQKYTVDVNELL